MIPRRFHFFGVGEPGQAAIPADVQANIDAWRRLYPEFEVTIWDMTRLVALGVELPGVPLLQAMAACRFLAARSDLARYAMLYRHGGHYNDLKNRPLRPFIEELEASAAGVVTEHPPTMLPVKRQLTNMYLAFEPGHPLMLRTLQMACRHVADRMPGSVFDVTGPGCLQKAARQSSAAERATVRVIPYETAWGDGVEGGWMRRTWASYNGPDRSRHWSERQKVEPMYMDGVVRQPRKDA